MPTSWKWSFQALAKYREENVKKSIFHNFAEECGWIDMVSNIVRFIEIIANNCDAKFIAKMAHLNSHISGTTQLILLKLTIDLIMYKNLDEHITQLKILSMLLQSKNT